MKLNCKKCGNSWNYKGNSVWYACCSRCHKQVNIKKQMPEPAGALTDEVK